MSYSLVRFAGSESIVVNGEGVAVGTVRRLHGYGWGWRDRNGLHAFPSVDAAAKARLRIAGSKRLLQMASVAS